MLVLKTENGNPRKRQYPILLDDLGEIPLPRNGSAWYLYEDKIPEVLPCHCQHQLTVIGARRCVDLLERIMGYDVGDGNAFPDYDRNILLGIARHINRENFNKYEPRAGAWKKYNFSPDGKPILPAGLV